MKQSKYLLILSKSRINLTKKEKLFLDLNQLKRINSCKIRTLSDLQIQGIRNKYSRFLKIITYEDLSKEKRNLLVGEDTLLAKKNFLGIQKRKTLFRLSVPTVKLLTK